MIKKDESVFRSIQEKDATEQKEKKQGDCIGWFHFVKLTKNISKAKEIAGKGGVLIKLKFNTKYPCKITDEGKIESDGGLE